MGVRESLTLNIELDEEKRACFDEETRFRATVENIVSRFRKEAAVVKEKEKL